MSTPARRRRGILFFIVGPSQVGKNAIIKRLLGLKSLRLRDVVTATTRAPRKGEVPGVSYHFVTDEKFDDMVKRKQFFEWARIQTHRSGTPKEPLMTWLSRGQNAVQDIDVQGADVLRKHPDLNIVSIFILPESLAVLKARFSRRKFTPHEAKVRWQTTLRELKQQHKYDYRVVNADGKLDQAVREVAGIIRAHTNATPSTRG